MRFDLKDKIQRRISPLPLMLYDIRRGIKGYRDRRVAAKHGEPIDFHGGDHLHVYATLRCCLNCYFCINKMMSPDGKIADFKEQNFGAWLSFLNRLYNIRELYFNGGEHFLLPWFSDLINALDNFNIVIFSNLPRLATKQFEKLKKGNNNIIIKSSYHPLEDEPLNMYVERSRHIPKEILWVPHVIRAKGVSTKMYIDGFRRYKIYATDDMLVYDRSQLKRRSFPVLCKTNEHQIGPDMRMYRCLVHMLRGEHAQPIKDYLFVHQEVECDQFPRCNTCSAYNEIRWIEEKNP
jgi:hypothetical protein